jgi:hypothetical protein
MPPPLASTERCTLRQAMSSKPNTSCAGSQFAPTIKTIE